MRRAGILSALVLCASLALAHPVRAQESCSRAVVFVLPGVTWELVDEVQPPALMSLIDEGAAGSMSVRSISSRTSFASGFASLGAGSRVEASRFAGAPRFGTVAGGTDAELFEENVAVAGLTELKADALEAGYDAIPGALATALGNIPVAAIGNSDTRIPPPAPAGYGRWALLAAMDDEGIVQRAATGSALLMEDDSAPWGVRTDPDAATDAIDEALAVECGVTFIDPGDLARVDEMELAVGENLEDDKADALLAADSLLSEVVDRLDAERDLVLALSPTSPWIEEEAHLGIVAVRGPGFEPGQTLQSASTRRAGVVTLPDVAPTILEHEGLPADTAMTGRPIFGVDSGGNVVEEAIETDRESIFVENMKTPITAGFVLAQILLYAIAVALLVRRSRPGETRRNERAAKWVEASMLAITAFPVTTYLAGIVDQHALGSPLVYVFVLGIDLVLVGAVYLFLKGPMNRMLALCAFTTLVLFVDLLTGARLQLNTVLGYSPIVAGRFAGLGNIAFAVMGVSGLLTGVLVAHGSKSQRRGLVGAAAVFAAVIIFDGAPQLGSDVGGVLALVPSLGLTLLLLSGKKLSLKFVAAGAVAGVLAVGAFLAIDLSRPPDEQTHLARLYEDVRDRGLGVMTDTIERKVSANVRLFKTSLWTYFVPPALIAIALLMRRPRGRWERLDETYPGVRAGLVGGLALAGFGFAVNDSGIVIPAVVLSFLVPLAIIVNLHIDSEPESTDA